MEISNTKRKRAMLLLYAETDVDEIFETLPNTGSNSDYDRATKSLKDYNSTKVSIAYEVYNFRQAYDARVKA